MYCSSALVLLPWGNEKAGSLHVPGRSDKSSPPQKMVPHDQALRVAVFARLQELWRAWYFGSSRLDARPERPDRLRDVCFRHGGMSPRVYDRAQRQFEGVQPGQLHMGSTVRAKSQPQDVASHNLARRNIMRRRVGGAPELAIFHSHAPDKIGMAHREGDDGTSTGVVCTTLIAGGWS